jgi:N-acetylmuramoyl-L-alanine amidase
MKRTRRLLSTLLLLLCPLTLFAETYTLKQILDLTGAQFRWDPYRKIGMLDRSDHTLLFRADDSMMIVDGKTKIETGTVIYDEKGRLVFSEQAARSIFQVFGVKHSDPPRYRVGIILIDPGHGGKDPGAVGTWTIDGTAVKLEEKHLNLDISLRLYDMLKRQYPDKKILLTRYDDSYMTLEERVEMTNGFELDPYEGMLFISVHANASVNKKAAGIEVWYLPPGFRREILTGESDEVFLPILNTLWEEELSLESSRLADMVLSGMLAAAAGRSPNRGVKQEGWFVVKNRKMASVLVETGFVTSQEEAALLRSTPYLADITSGLFNGIVKFITYFESRVSSP